MADMGRSIAKVLGRFTKAKGKARDQQFRNWQDPENYSDRDFDGMGSLTVNGDPATTYARQSRRQGKSGKR